MEQAADEVRALKQRNQQASATLTELISTAAAGHEELEAAAQRVSAELQQLQQQQDAHEAHRPATGSLLPPGPDQARRSAAAGYTKNLWPGAAGGKNRVVPGCWP